MEIDEGGWHDLNERLDSLGLQPAHRDALIDHLTNRFVGHFGADSFELHLGKNDPRRHAMREAAAAAIAHLAPVFDQLPEGSISALIDNGEVGSSMPAPWDDHWRDDPRTASWRS